MEDREVRDLLRIGKALRHVPALDEAFRQGVLCWSKVRALVPVIKPENAASWIAKAQRMSSNELEHDVGATRDPVVGGGLVPMISVPRRVWRRFQFLAEKARERTGTLDLSDWECFEKILDAAEEAWKGAGVIENLTQQSPVSGGAHPYRTEVRFLVDADTLYVGFLCHDPQPKKIAVKAQGMRGDGGGGAATAGTPQKDKPKA